VPLSATDAATILGVHAPTANQTTVRACPPPVRRQGPEPNPRIKSRWVAERGPPLAAACGGAHLPCVAVHGRRSFAGVGHFAFSPSGRASGAARSVVPGREACHAAPSPPTTASTSASYRARPDWPGHRYGPGGHDHAGPIHAGRGRAVVEGARVVATPQGRGTAGAVHVPGQAPALLPHRSRRDHHRRCPTRCRSPAPAAGSHRPGPRLATRAQPEGASTRPRRPHS
jgi:hypothetical protein